MNTFDKVLAVVALVLSVLALAAQIVRMTA